MPVAHASELIRNLPAVLAGRVVVPGDPDYEQMRKVFPGGVDRRPAAIVRPQNAEDVRHVVTRVRRTGRFPQLADSRGRLGEPLFQCLPLLLPGMWFTSKAQDYDERPRQCSVARITVGSFKLVTALAYRRRIRWQSIPKVPPAGAEHRR